MPSRQQKKRAKRREQYLKNQEAYKARARARYREEAEVVRRWTKYEAEGARDVLQSPVQQQQPPAASARDPPPRSKRKKSTPVYIPPRAQPQGDQGILPPPQCNRPSLLLPSPPPLIPLINEQGSMSGVISSGRGDGIQDQNKMVAPCVHCCVQKGHLVRNVPPLLALGDKQEPHEPPPPRGPPPLLSEEDRAAGISDVPKVGVASGRGVIMEGVKMSVGNNRATAVRGVATSSRGRGLILESVARMLRIAKVESCSSSSPLHAGGSEGVIGPPESTKAPKVSNEQGPPHDIGTTNEQGPPHDIGTTNEQGPPHDIATTNEQGPPHDALVKGTSPPSR